MAKDESLDDDLGTIDEDGDEDIVIIEESAAAGEISEEIVDDEKPKLDLKKVAIAVIALLFLILLGILIYLLSSNDEEAPKEDLVVAKTKLKKYKEIIDPSKIEKLISKANYLYTSGNKEEALKIYEKIAIFSESISDYNLGVAQIKEKQYQKARDSFKKSIANNENICVSALNSAVCSLYLKDKESFDYYLGLATAYLPKESGARLYSYYYALINYYKSNYIETLSALKHPTSQDYLKEKSVVQAEVQTILGDYYGAVDTIDNFKESKKDFMLGLEYANIGDLTLAKKYLSQAKSSNPNGIKENLALGFILLKSGQYKKGATALKKLTEKYKEKVYEPYPIKVFLKETLFIPDDAQKHYRNNTQSSNYIKYQKLFYFAPYKVFNANKTISYIRKGSANIYIDDIASAKEYLKKSASSSKINFSIASAIEKALNFQLRDANKELVKMLEIYPKHSILQYNIGLTYAQMGDFVNAYKHFLLSFHQDAKNYLSGIFAIMSAQIIEVDHIRLTNLVRENLMHEDESDSMVLYRTLLSVTNDNYVNGMMWLDRDLKKRSLHLMLNVLIASDLELETIAKQSAKNLCYQHPNDILPRIIYIDTHFNKENTKTYAKSVLDYLNKQKFTFDDLYFGPFITRYVYTQMALLTGRLYPLREQLKYKLETTTQNADDIIAALALASIYSKDFENSYTLYNQLIDEYKIQDSLTLFLAAVASTGADHHANAIALLKLANIKFKNNKESRYALGVLYMEAKNNLGASIELKHIGDSGFISAYFNFKVDTDLLLFNKEKKSSDY
ncbi:MAG: hypothetical protein GQ570_10175 [Helicobacteraceae bacterium]|nr:hypothetical protein [Helicobacteraceae bacterium]